MEEPPVFANAPYFTLGFEMVYIRKEFTQFQMKLHYTWVFVALLFMFVPKIGFFYEMMQLHQSFWSRQQVCFASLIPFALLYSEHRACQGLLGSNVLTSGGAFVHSDYIPCLVHAEPSI